MHTSQLGLMCGRKTSCGSGHDISTISTTFKLQYNSHVRTCLELTLLEHIFQQQLLVYFKGFGYLCRLDGSLSSFLDKIHVISFVMSVAAFLATLTL